MKTITFIHAADLHLDSPMVGLGHIPKNIYNRLINSTFTSLTKIVDTAIERQVDFVIISGDIYDGEDRSIRAQIKFRQQMERLSDNQIPVFLIHGNHDHLSGDWTQITLPNNVTVFGGEVELKEYIKEGIKVHLYGFSYPYRQVKDRKIADYQKVEGADFHIGLLHGNDGGSAHSNYAPFTIKELNNKQFDYWALGHIHKRNILQEYPPIVYPGNIQGRHTKEEGSKGCYLVTLTEVDCKLTFIETSDIVWDTLQIDASHCYSFQEVYQLCLDHINIIRSVQNVGKIIKLVIHNLQSFGMREGVINDELLEILQENEEHNNQFVWVSKIQINSNVSVDLDKLKNDEGFFQELFSAMNKEAYVDEALTHLFQHPSARKFLSPLNDYEISEMTKGAEQLLIELLHSKVKDF